MDRFVLGLKPTKYRTVDGQIPRRSFCRTSYVNARLDQVLLIPTTTQHWWWTEGALQHTMYLLHRKMMWITWHKTAHSSAHVHTSDRIIIQWSHRLLQRGRIQWYMWLHSSAANIQAINTLKHVLKCCYFRRDVNTFPHIWLNRSNKSILNLEPYALPPYFSHVKVIHVEEVLEVVKWILGASFIMLRKHEECFHQIHFYLVLSAVRPVLGHLVRALWDRS